MKLNYDIYYGTFIHRPNRFIAVIKRKDEELIAHVPNTGRLKELLLPGAEVMLSYHPNPLRKTKYELRMIKKGMHWISIDSQLPNALASEAISAGIIKELMDYPLLKREVVYGNSRFDIQLSGKDTCFVEVKGVTLEKEGWSYFPDAPTERGRKHIDEMIQAVQNGHRGVLLFVVQLNTAKGFSPNSLMDPAFAQKIVEASNAGVEILAYRCVISPEEVNIVEKIPVSFQMP
ncbi:DNA/RNA nuclease SfsA [Cellulosilyticum sp. I15G10I2]|uniref:DNA/RNA nuclease SfsA n=1 Tax=Cellulosilyticum sp. I15G10I2 TaxID=1892843 RepID=UPI00085C4189|nr:DNA/RNA nuclease SfsA [Cellulosilyticum sp. I15G10I2]